MLYMKFSWFGNEPYQLTPIVELMFDNEGNPFSHRSSTAGRLAAGGVTAEIAAYPKVVRVDEEIAHSAAIEPAVCQF